MLVTSRPHPIGPFVGLYNVTPEPRAWPRYRIAQYGLTDPVDALTGDKIATEDDAKDIAALKAFLLKVNHPVVDGVSRKVDGKKITEGWKLEEVDDDIKEKVMAYIEKTGGDINMDTVKSELALTEGQFMQVVEALQEDGVLE